MDKLSQRLHRLLDEEKAALLAGNYGELDQISNRMATCLSEVSQGSSPSVDLRDIKQKLLSNQELTASALRGVHAARARWAELEKVRDGLTTYDPSGKVAIVAQQQRRVEKKA